MRLLCKYKSTRDLPMHNQLGLPDIQFSYSCSSISCRWFSTVFQLYCNVLRKLVHRKSTSHFCPYNLDIFDEGSDTDTTAFFLVSLGFHRFGKSFRKYVTVSSKEVAIFFVFLLRFFSSEVENQNLPVTTEIESESLSASARQSLKHVRLREIA